VSGQRGNFLFTVSWSLNADSTNPDAARKVLAALTSPEAQQWVLERGLAIPSRSALADNPFFQQEGKESVLNRVVFQGASGGYVLPFKFKNLGGDWKSIIDEASWWQQFTHVTIPMLRPVTFLVVTLSLIGTLQLFDQVALFGNAVPLESKITLAFFVYDSAFPSAAQSKIGLASAAAMVLGVLTLLVVLLQRRLGISEEGY